MESFSEQLALLIQRGGYFMIPLFVLSVISVALIIERAWFWTAVHGPRRNERLRKLNEAMRRGDVTAVEALISGDRSPYAHAVRALIEGGATDAVAMEAVESQRPRLDRFMVTLSTIITAAPLLGILGTVIGIIQSFQLLGTQQTLSDPREVAGGIAAALLTTALGLIVALMTLFPFMIFRGHVERSLGRLESMIAAAQQGASVIAGREGSPARNPRRERATRRDPEPAAGRS